MGVHVPSGNHDAFFHRRELPQDFHKNVGESWFPGDRTDHDIVALHVGRTPPNAWGVYDMHGNVEEWCLDWYGPYTAVDQVDPVGLVDGDFRVTRGGSHSTQLEFLRSANRAGTLPDDKSWLIGFRVVQGELPATSALPIPGPAAYAVGVRQEVPADLASGPDPEQPYFCGPRVYVRAPSPADCPAYNRHNHCPALVNCPNGDLLAIWYTCRDEPGRELAIVASRLAVWRSRVAAGVQFLGCARSQRPCAGPVGGRAGNDLSFQRSVGGSHLGQSGYGDANVPRQWSDVVQGAADHAGTWAASHADRIGDPHSRRRDPGPVRRGHWR